MPAHIKARPDRGGGLYYLIDGEIRKSLGTSKRGLAQLRLEQYIRGEFGLGPELTLKEFYEKWIALRVEDEAQGLIRPSALRDYRQHFSSRILPALGDRQLCEITVDALNNFRSKILKTAKLKTARNIIDGSFRALWRAARKEKAAREDPFELVEWPTRLAPAPDPFTAEERDKIIEWWRINDYFYYPWIKVQFSTGMRPSEASALKWSDIDLQSGSIVISKSLDLGKESAPKTRHSGRTIAISPEIAAALKILPSRALGIDSVFVSKLGRPMTKKWAQHNWSAPLVELGIRHRKFYSTRHTFITEAIKRGDEPLAVAQYCGTSVQMIQDDYCGKLDLDRTKIAPAGQNCNEIMVAGPGFEPVDDFERMCEEVRRLRVFKGAQLLKSA